MYINGGRLLLSLGVLGVLLAGSAEMAGAYVYEVSVDSLVTEDFTPEEETSTYWVCASAQGAVDEGAKKCSAVGHAYAEGFNGTARKGSGFGFWCCQGGGRGQTLDFGVALRDAGW
jgi:hypothetical protein